MGYLAVEALGNHLWYLASGMYLAVTSFPAGEELRDLMHMP